MADYQHLTVLKQGVAEWNGQRRSLAISRPELSSADLSGMDLTGVDLRLADLSGANLAGATLTAANLTAANLRRADLTKAVLLGADFTLAVLVGTILRQARLGWAKFQESLLAGADWTAAEMNATVLSNVDLRDAIGLDHVEHTGPSTIGVDTLYNLGDSCHRSFLQKAGVPRALLDYLPSLLPSAIELYSCFISYSHSDKLFAERLYDSLQGYGVRCWLDSHHLFPGDIRCCG